MRHVPAWRIQIHQPVQASHRERWQAPDRRKRVSSEDLFGSAQYPVFIDTGELFESKKKSRFFSGQHIYMGPRIGAARGKNEFSRFLQGRKLAFPVPVGVKTFQTYQREGLCHV